MKHFTNENPHDVKSGINVQRVSRVLAGLTIKCDRLEEFFMNKF